MVSSRSLGPRWQGIQPPCEALSDPARAPRGLLGLISLERLRGQGWWDAPQERGSLSVPSLGTAAVCTTLRPVPCGPQALGTTVATQEEAWVSRGWSLAWVLWLPTLLSHKHRGGHMSARTSLGAGVAALPLVHHELVQFLCASVYLSMKEGWGS